MVGRLARGCERSSGRDLIFHLSHPHRCSTETCVALLLQYAHAEPPPLGNGTAESRLEHNRVGEAQSDECVESVRALPEEASPHRNEITLYIADPACGPAERANATAAIPAVSPFTPTT